MPKHRTRIWKSIQTYLIIDTELYERLVQYCKRRKITIDDAITEAVRRLLEKYGRVKS